MPHDPVTIDSEFVEKDAPGQNDRIILTKYEAPSTPEGAVASDPYKERDIAIAKSMRAWLEKHYPGHLWGCVSDLKQGIVKFNIPILMGVQNWWVINLHTHDIVDGLRQGAGQILERYRLKRGRFDLNSFLEARQKHSALVIPSRKVPV